MMDNWVAVKNGRITKILLIVWLTAGFAVQTLGAEEAREGFGPAHFVFSKQGNLFANPSAMPAPGPYYTCLVNMKGVKGFPYDYALYFSTDHDVGRGGVWMYVCNGLPTVADNWKSYDQAVGEGDFDYLDKRPAGNPIFVDTIEGSQTETPHANVIDGIVYMTYHNAGAGRNQSTLLATSQDGIHFSRINGEKDSVILDYQGEPGDGHTGYFRWGLNPFTGVAYEYVGYSLHGGGDYYNSAMWGSDNAIDWDKLEVLSPEVGAAIDGESLLIWHEIDPNSIISIGNGEYIAIGAGGTSASGAMSRTVELYEIFLAEDGRTLTRKSRKVLANGSAGADDEEEVAEPTTIVIGDTWHLIYVGTREQGGRNSVMAATGKLDNLSPESPAFKIVSVLQLLLGSHYHTLRHGSQ